MIAVATGALPRRPPIAGQDGPRVVDMWQLLNGDIEVGDVVAVVVQEDHAAPLALADLLGRQGKRVTLFVQTNAPAPLLSRYSLGTLLGRLSEVGARIVANEAVTAIDLPGIVTRHVYSGRKARHDGFDSVVLACGAVPDSALFTAVEAQLPQVHVLGDAFAPRRIAFAVQQGYQLAKIL